MKINTGLEFIKNIRNDLSLRYKEELCDKCRTLGYCKSLADKDGLPCITRAISIRDFKDMIPLKEQNSNFLLYTDKAIENLQDACDAFHQNDFETAIYLFRIILSNNEHYATHLNRYTAISYFFAKDYVNAMKFMVCCVDKVYGIDKPMGIYIADMCIDKINENTNEHSKKTSQRLIAKLFI